MLKSLQRNKPNLIPNFERQLGFRRKAVAVIFLRVYPILNGKSFEFIRNFCTFTQKFRVWTIDLRHQRSITYGVETIFQQAINGKIIQIGYYPTSYKLTNGGLDILSICKLNCRRITFFGQMYSLSPNTRKNISNHLSYTALIKNSLLSQRI